MDRWAAELPSLREVQRRSGRVPGPLRERPELSPVNELYWIAYCDLSKNRPIALTEILAYAELTCLDKTELFVKVNAIEEALNGNNNS